MKLAFTKKFNKQVAKITSKELADEIIAVIMEAESAVKISNISNIKKLSGYKFYYRIRIGDYRIGLFLNNDTHWSLQLLITGKIFTNIFPERLVKNLLNGISLSLSRDMIAAYCLLV